MIIDVQSRKRVFTLALWSLSLSAGERPNSLEGSDEVAALQTRQLVKPPISAARHQENRTTLAMSSSHASCSDSWEIFGRNPTTSTRVVASADKQLPLEFSNPASFGRFADARTGMFVFPEYRFAFCTIAKAASSEWVTVFAKMFYNDTSLADKRLAKNIPLASVDDMESVFSDPGATSAVMVREPLARIASAFLDKCNLTAVQNASCPMVRTGTSGRDLTLRDAVEWMLENDPATMEFHWMLQSEYCQLRDRVREYDVIMLYSKEHLSADATCLMKLAGIERFNSLGPAHNDAPFWTDLPRQCEGFEELSEQEPVPVSCTEKAEVTMLKALFPPDVARRVMNHFRQDYITFNLPEPTWVANATGALYDTPIRELSSAMEKPA